MKKILTFLVLCLVCLGVSAASETFGQTQACESTVLGAYSLTAPEGVTITRTNSAANMSFYSGKSDKTFYKDDTPYTTNGANYYRKAINNGTAPDNTQWAGYKLEITNGKKLNLSHINATIYVADDTYTWCVVILDKNGTEKYKSANLTTKKASTAVLNSDITVENLTGDVEIQLWVAQGGTTKYFTIPTLTLTGEVVDDIAGDYTITCANDLTGGSIVADKETANAGDEVILIATPNADYNFTSWDVKDALSNAITVTDNKFTMPASNVTVSATFTKKPLFAITKAAGIEHGDITISAAEAYEGQVVDLAPMPDAGYGFRKWKVTKTEDASDITSTVVSANKLTMPAYAVTVGAIYESMEETVIGNTLIFSESPINAKKFNLDNVSIVMGSPAEGWVIDNNKDPEEKAMTITVNGINFEKYVSTSSTNGSNGTGLKQDGSDNKNYIAFSPDKNGEMVVAMNNAADKNLYIVEDGKAIAATLIGDGTDEGNFKPLDAGGKVQTAWGSGKAYSGGVKFNVKANSKYSISLNGSKGRWCGFIFTPTLETFDLTVPSGQWASVCMPFKATIPDGYKAYYAKSLNETTVSLTQVDGAIPANAGVVVTGAAGTATFTETSADAADLSANKFIGTTAAATVDANSTYVLNGTASTAEAPKFSLFTGTEIPANKAYLAKPSSGKLDVIFGEATGVATLSTVNSQQSTAIYNLQGVRVNDSYKGIVISNGKKILVK